MKSGKMISRSIISVWLKMNKHSAEFERFKKHSNSTLMGMTKEELVSYIECIYNNWAACDLAFEFHYALTVALRKECPNFDFNQFTHDYWVGKGKE